VISRAVSVGSITQASFLQRPWGRAWRLVSLGACYSVSRVSQLESRDCSMQAWSKSARTVGCSIVTPTRIVGSRNSKIPSLARGSRHRPFVVDRHIRGRTPQPVQSWRAARDSITPPSVVRHSYTDVFRTLASGSRGMPPAVFEWGQPYGTSSRSTNGFVDSTKCLICGYVTCPRRTPGPARQNGNHGCA